MMRDTSRHKMLEACFTFLSEQRERTETVQLKHLLFAFPLYLEHHKVTSDPFTSHMRYYAEEFLILEHIAMNIDEYVGVTILNEIAVLFPEFRLRLQSYFIDNKVKPNTKYRLGSSSPAAIEDMIRQAT